MRDRRRELPAAFAPLLEKMANLSAVRTVGEKLSDAAAFVVKTTQYFVPLPGKIDAAEELPKLEAELEYLEGFLASVNKKLSNERFVQSAPEKVVANERAKQADAEAKIAALREPDRGAEIAAGRVRPAGCGSGTVGTGRVAGAGCNCAMPLLYGKRAQEMESEPRHLPVAPL